MTPGYDPNKGTDDFRRELGEDEVSSFCIIEHTRIREKCKKIASD